MTSAALSRSATPPTASRPLRLWPGVVIVAVQWIVRFGAPSVAPDGAAAGIIGGLVGGLAIGVWWLGFSRAPWAERLGALLVMIAALAVTPQFCHKSISGGMMGMLYFVYAIPVLSLVFVVWAVAARDWGREVRRFSMVAAIVGACGVFALLRTGGMTGDADSDFHWRWSATPEQRLLEQAGASPAGGGAVPALGEGRGVWAGFRGAARDGVVRGVRIATDWSANPPLEVWRQRVGPGWSSFGVSGGRIFTQEQRGEEEVVACYSLATGALIWMQRDAARFWESNAGAGPRATPAVEDDRVYALGATGILNALNATNGAVIWSRNAASDTKIKVPEWGFAGSPLLVDDLVIVATAGTLAAYAVATGEPRWFGPSEGWGYSSPHLASLQGVRQILLLNGIGVISVTVDSGQQLWRYEWRGDGIVQPGLTADGNVLIGTGSGLGSRVRLGVLRLAVERGPAGWEAQERWTSIGLKPYFNDFVVHGDHAFGFDGGMLACIELREGRRQWKDGRYGHGQLILLADHDLLLVLSEQGSLALVAADPAGYREHGRTPVLEGKTWNHPVVVDDLLLVRNAEEMAAFRLPLAGR